MVQAELLRLVGVSRAFRGGGRVRLPVLANASLSVAPGEIVAVVGSRDEGKTTLLEIAAGIQPPDCGEVWFGDLELTKLTDGARAELLGRDIRWVRREGTGVRFDVLDYVGLPLVIGRGHGYREAEKLALDALDRVGAADCADRAWGHLSNWERVQVSFARGIVGSPRLLLVDDVMDGLGMSRTRHAGELLCSLARDSGFGVLMSVTDLEAALIADRVLCFERGGLRVMSDQTRHDAEVIEFPDGARQARGARTARS
jgi:putative ABC transport system ATP-binding protein